MMATSRKFQADLPGEIETLLPWHAAGTLSERDTSRIDGALAVDPNLARQYAEVRKEYAEIILLNEGLGIPSLRTMHRLFTAIDAEPPRVGAQLSSIPSRW